MAWVMFVLKRPYTVVAGLILICIMGVGAALRMPIDIFPEIDIPVVSVVWTYAGMTPLDIQNRILTLHERQLASLVDDISRIEATSYYGVGVLKVYLHEGADVTRAVAQLASSALVVLNTCRRISRRRWSCGMVQRTCRSSNSACRAAPCRTPS
ncbi:MAG: Swarming motility protein SwrC [Beijerinckiaceae bacterium]|nr:MAG: Swarming motility protein SwrC [Beijerinckiaceae bacterium]